MSFSLNCIFVWQREERKMLRELKVFLDQLERDVLRAQGAEGNLTDKYQVKDKALEMYCSTLTTTFIT